MHAQIECGSASFVIPVDRPIVVGRAIDCDIRLFEDVRVSRLHCKIWIQGEVIALEDLSSANGTAVNGYDIEEAVQLQDGDVVRVGETPLTIRLNMKEAKAGGQTTVIDGNGTVRPVDQAAEMN